MHRGPPEADEVQNHPQHPKSRPNSTTLPVTRVTPDHSRSHSDLPPPESQATVRTVHSLYA